MCGIFGIVSFNTKEFLAKKNLMEQGLLTSAVRGTDGTGVFMIPQEADKESVLYKKPMPSADFLSLSMTDKLFQDVEHYKYVIGHTRAKTRGDATYGNTHPFIDGPITMVHNGTISNAWEMAGNTFTEVDSKAIAIALAKTENKIETLSSIEGAYALVWYDAREDALFVTRNEERPLYMVISNEKELVVIGSELPMLTWLCARNGVEISHKIDVTPYSLVTFKDGIKFRVTKYKKKEKVTKIYQNYGNAYDETSGWDWRRGRTALLPAKTVSIEYEEAKVNELLAGTEYKKNSKIDFNVDEIMVKSNRSRHGTVTGYMWVDPYLNVEAHGVVLDGVGKDQMYSGTIIAVKKTGHELTVVLSPTITRCTANNNSTALVPLAEEVPGPLGPISPEEFAKLIEDGCAFCNGPVFPTDKLRWTRDNRPICITCSPKVHDCGALLN